MAYDPGRNRLNPLLIGAIAVILSLAAFLFFRDSADMTQQAGLESGPPAATTPAPSATPPPKSSPAEPQGDGSGSL